MFGTMPIAAPVHSAAGRIPSRSTRRTATRPTPWRLLRRLLLDSYGAVVRRRRYERAVDRHDLCLRAYRKDCAGWSPDLPDSRSRICRGWDLDCSWVVTDRRLAPANRLSGFVGARRLKYLGD